MNDGVLGSGWMQLALYHEDCVAQSQDRLQGKRFYSCCQAINLMKSLDATERKMRMEVAFLFFQS